MPFWGGELSATGQDNFLILVKIQYSARQQTCMDLFHGNTQNKPK